MAEKSTPKQRRRGPGRRFQKGQSGNPAGKPKGARHQLTILAEKLMHDDAEAIVQSVLKAAKGGDMTAARLVLERIAPVRKGRPVAFDVPAITTADDLVGAISSLLSAMSQGDVTPDEAATIAGVLDVKRRAIETSDLVKRIEAIEAKESAHGDA